MVKLLGAVCILGAGGWVWRRGAAERRRSLDALADVIALLERMGQEIRLRRTGLPRLLEALSRGRTAEVRGFCGAVAAAMDRDAPLGESWRSAAEDLPLDPEERRALASLGEALQGDEESVCKAISLTNQSLRKSLEEARNRRAERERRAGALWLSGAALLVILLI